MTRSSCSTWVRSPSSGRTGARRWASSARSLAGSAPTDSITRKLFALIARAHQMLGDSAGGAAGLRRGAGARPRGRRAAVPQGGGAPAPRRVGRGRAVLAADPDAHAARAVLQRRPGDLRAPDPAQPGGAGRRARRPRRGRAALAEVLAECPGDREAWPWPSGEPIEQTSRWVTNRRIRPNPPRRRDRQDDHRTEVPTTAGGVQRGMGWIPSAPADAIRRRRMCSMAPHQRRTPMSRPRLLFASIHGYLDPSSGAASAPASCWSSWPPAAGIAGR